MSPLFYLPQRIFLHIRQYTLLYVSIAALIFIYPREAQCEYIAQIDMQQAGIFDSIYIKLLENDAPITVQNFRNYMNDGDYANSFIHRSRPGFIVQGGGFTFDPTLNDGSFSYDKTATVEYPGGLQPVPEDVTIVNEFGNSNLLGTLAMAKLGSDPDSATSQWFVNLVDNSFLDSQNGGYTVFAEVLGNGMDVFDAVASQQVFDGTAIHPAFGDIPLVNYLLDPVPLNPEIDASLIRINAITEVLSISPDIIYGTVTPGTNLQPEVVILNTGVNSVSIGSIGVQNPLLPPYSIVTDLCSNRVLSPGQRCAFIALFSPTSSDAVFDDSFDIELPGLGLSYEIMLSGISGPAAVETDFSSTFSSYDFGVKGVLFNSGDSPYIATTTIKNSGGIDLQINTIALSPDSDTEFSISNEGFVNSVNCVDIIILAPNETCKVKVLYHPLVAGSHTAKLSFESNDPDEGIFEIPIFASATAEPDISSTLSSFDFGVKGVLFNPEDSPYITTTTITNSGGMDLQINAIALSQDSDAEFSISNEGFANSVNCIAISILAANKSCEVEVLYHPRVAGDHTAKLIFESNDPDEGIFEIPILASAIKDTDGVTVEDAAPNNGDGNNDDIPDSQQSNVVSLPDLKGIYNTYVTDKALNQFFFDVRIISQNTTDKNPDNVVLEAGVHELTLNNVAPDAIVDVGLLLPAGVDVSAYYVYGPTPESSTPQWYEFDIDGETGASIIGVAKFTSPSGNTVDRNVIFLRIKNGGRGDSSNLKDNIVVVKSGINYSNSKSNNDSGGSLSFFLLQTIVLTILFFRFFYRPVFVGYRKKN